MARETATEDGARKGGAPQRPRYDPPRALRLSGRMKGTGACDAGSAPNGDCTDGPFDNFCMHGPDANDDCTNGDFN